MNVQVEWKGNMTFEVQPPSGVNFNLDSSPDHGGGGTGPTPVEALLGSLAACTAMDVVSILAKKKQSVTAYRLEVRGERTEAGVWPRPFKSITVKHYLSGPNLDAAAVARAIELSDEKYCTVIATIKAGPKISTCWEIVEPVLSP